MSASGHADLIFQNGAVYTVDAARSWAHAVAVRDGRIVAVGTDDEIRAMAGPATEVVDLAGGMLVPGFQDAHVHPVGGGLDMLQCDMHDLATQEDYLLAVKTYAEEHPEREWILGGGWAMDVFPGGTPTKELLDAIAPDRCVFLPNRDGHGAWVNSRALEVAGVTNDTPDPDDGRIERTADGQPSGTLHEGAMDLVARHAPPPTPAEMAEGLLRGQEYLHSLGITAWQDAIVDDHDHFGRNYTTYVEAAGRGDLTARVVGALWWDRHRGAEQIEEFVDLRARGAVGRFAATSVKIMQDGVCENFTAAVLEPYLDAHGQATDNRGISFVEPEALKGYVTELDRLGFQVHFHALAERAVREALDAIEAALVANGPERQPPSSRPICRSCTPTTSRGSGRSARSRTPSRSGRPTNRRWTTSRSRSSGSPAGGGSTRSRSLVRAGAMLADGQRLERVEPRSACRRCMWRSTGRCRRTTPTRSNGARCSCQTSGSTCRRRSPPSRWGRRT